MEAEEGRVKGEKEWPEESRMSPLDVSFTSSLQQQQQQQQQQPSAWSASDTSHRRRRFKQCGGGRGGGGVQTTLERGMLVDGISSPSIEDTTNDIHPDGEFKSDKFFFRFFTLNVRLGICFKQMVGVFDCLSVCPSVRLSDQKSTKNAIHGLFAN